MVRDVVRERFEPWRSLHRRKAWQPIVRDGVLLPSRFGGAPSLREDDLWPDCVMCSVPMRFFLQLELGALPPKARMRGKGLLQLFYCSSDEGACESWRPFSGAHHLRIVPAEGTRVGRNEVEPLPLRSIKGWREVDDVPDPSEHERLGLRYDYDFERGKVAVKWGDVAFTELPMDQDIAEAISESLTGDKLRGWPHWVQNVEYPSCPRCSRTMELVFQLDSENNLDYMFGDVGCGHITQCPEHDDVLAFGWACS